MMQYTQTCTPLFFNADPINTGVNNLLIVALLMAAYVLYMRTCYHVNHTKLPLVLLLLATYPQETFHQVYHPR